MEAKVGGHVFEISEPQMVRKQVLRVGDRVAVLEKGSSYTAPKIHDGVVIGFEPFRSLPSIKVAYVEVEYQKGSVKTLVFNDKSDEAFELVAAMDDRGPFEYQKALAMFDSQVADAERALEKITAERAYFIRHWQRTMAVAADSVTE